MAGKDDETLADSTVSDFKDIQIKDLFIKLSKATPKSSVAWNYFGDLYFCQPTTKIVANFQNRTFCKLCFEQAAIQEANLFDIKKIKNFSAKTSTANLFSHLDTEHKISIKSKSEVESTKSVQHYFNVDRNKVQRSADSDKKSVLKIRQIVKLLRYRTSEMERLSKDEELFISEMSHLSEQFLITEDDDDDDDDDHNENSTYKTLKIDVKTRWNSTVPMIESFVVNNKSVMKFLLQKAGCAELVLSPFEYNLLKELLDFLKNFEVITAIFSGSKYATLNYYVMFRQEIRSLLEIEPQESIEIKELKDNMLKKFEHRFPLSDETVLASLLDPRFQNLLDVQRYLKAQGYTAVEFIQKCSRNIVSVDSRSTEKPHASAPQHGPKLSYINEMVEKHSTLASIARSTSHSEETNLQRECFLLLSMGGVATVKDVLMFWKENSAMFPLLSQVAAATYCVPATSTPSERNFSTSGQCTDSKKSQITPENLDKMVFMHNNYDFIKKHCPSKLPI